LREVREGVKREKRRKIEERERESRRREQKIMKLKETREETKISVLSCCLDVCRRRCETHKRGNFLWP
jgi:hypothetical protein